MGETFPRQLKELLPSIRERRAEIEAARTLPPDLVDSLSETGIFRRAVPHALGGDEADPLDLMQAIETVSAADGSAGWCSMIALGNGLVAGYMSGLGAKEVFSDPAFPTAGLAAPSGAAQPMDGGYSVSGSWKFASGILHCDWVWAGCVVVEDGTPRMTPTGPEMVHVFMPTAEIDIHDTWFASGLCGTGSNDFSATGVFVPEGRAFSLFDVSGHRPEPLYQMPVLALFSTHVATVGLGIARAALDEFTELAGEKVPSFSTARLAEKPVTHVEIARAEGVLGGARSFLYDTVDDLWQTVSAGRPPTPRQRGMCRIAAVHAAETAARVTATVCTLGGGTAISVSSPLQRHARDAQAVTHHVTQSPQTWEEAGRVLMGLDPLFPLF